MRIIHTGDIHLNSPLDSSFPCEKALIRSNELLQSFKNTVDFAIENKINVIIIAGDFFDCNNISFKVEKFVFDVISAAENIDFLYLCGNHDDNVAFRNEIPENLIMLENGEKHFYSNVCISGFENYDNIDFDSESYNIAVMHGEIVNGYEKYQVNLKALENKNINYLALGHIHKGGSGVIDKRGKYAYCGIPEARGFDENGDKGFLIIDTDTDEIEFVKNSLRTVVRAEVDITGVSSNYELAERIEKELSSLDKKSIVKVILTGTYCESFVKDIPFTENYFENKFFHFAVKDSSRLKIDFSDYENDISLKGEFIRLAKSEDISEEIRERIITVGLNALDNEDLGI